MNKKEIVTMEFNNEEMNLLSEAVELLYNRTIGEMMFKTEDDLRELLNKIKNSEEFQKYFANKAVLKNIYIENKLINLIIK